MKKFICGFLVGAMLSSVAGVFAVSYIANPADFKVLVNGKEFVSDPPALIVEGRTYLPLRAMGDALGVPVTWNEELRQAEVGNSAPVAEANEYSRTNPAPLNTVQIFTHTNKYDSDYQCSESVRIIETLRGKSAWEKIKKDNSFNDEAPEGYEYILAKIAVSVWSTPDGKSMNINSWNFDCFSGNNEEYDDVYVSIDNELSATLYAGGNAEGYLVFCVKTDDENPKVVYERSYDGKEGIWFSLQ